MFVPRNTLRTQLERKLLTLYKETGEIDFPNEDWVFEVLPELNSLENDTLDALLYQAATHAKCVHALEQNLGVPVLSRVEFPRLQVREGGAGVAAAGAGGGSGQNR